MAHAPGHQQADHRGGPLRRRRVGLLAGLAADEALLPHRAARPRPTRTRSASPSSARNVRRDRPAAPQGRRRSPCRSAGSCPSRSRRSSGSARTPRVELQRKIGLLRDDLRASRGVQLKWHDPKATLVEGIASRGDRRLGAGHRGRCGATAACSRSGASTSTSTCGPRPWPSHGLDDRLVRPPPPHRGRGAARGTTSRPGCTRTSCGRTGATPSPRSGLEDCRWTPCYDCGACTGYGIEHVVASATPPAGGSQGTGQDLARRRRRCPVTLLAPQAGRSGRR